MVECRSCMRRFVQLCSIETQGNPHAPLIPLAPRLASSWLQSSTSRRNYAIAVIREDTRQTELPIPPTPPPPSPLRQLSNANHEQKWSRESPKQTATGRRSPQGSFNKRNGGERPPQIQPRVFRPPRMIGEYKVANLDKELSWMPDPLKLAEKVQALVREGSREEDWEKAAALVRMASKDMPVTVAWNHLVDWQLRRGAVVQAIKIYNEMKKRAQIPNSHTFTILLRGFARNSKQPNILKKALHLYESMSKENAPVRPSLTHTNALLQVCALTGDKDALFGIAAKLSSHGRGAPDQVTFTTILNGIYQEAHTKCQDLPTEDLESIQIRATAVDQAKRIWGEIRDRWAKGDIILDEELVCAMGRILLLRGSEVDNDSVLALLEQTMLIPRQAPVLQLKEPTAPKENRRTRRAKAREAEALEDSVTSTEASTPAIDEVVKAESDAKVVDLGEEVSDPFGPISKARAERNPIIPKQKTLSLAIEACTALRLSSAAQDYWGLLTDPTSYNIEPDAQNYHTYLRLLRFRRASKLTMEIVQEMYNGSLTDSAVSKDDENDSRHKRTRMLQPKTFRIALSTCARDSNNRNALDHATTILRIMTTTLEDPDPLAVERYIHCALGHQPQDWRLLLSILRTVAGNMSQLRAKLALDIAQKPQSTATPSSSRSDAKASLSPAGLRTEWLRKDILKLASKVISLADTILALGKEELVPVYIKRKPVDTSSGRAITPRARTVALRADQDDKKYILEVRNRMLGFCRKDGAQMADQADWRASRGNAAEEDVNKEIVSRQDKDRRSMVGISKARRLGAGRRLMRE